MTKDAHNVCSKARYSVKGVPVLKGYGVKKGENKVKGIRQSSKKQARTATDPLPSSHNVQQLRHSDGAVRACGGHSVPSSHPLRFHPHAGPAGSCDATVPLSRGQRKRQEKMDRVQRKKNFVAYMEKLCEENNLKKQASITPTCCRFKFYVVCL